MAHGQKLTSFLEVRGQPPDPPLASLFIPMKGYAVMQIDLDSQFATVQDIEGTYRIFCIICLHSIGTAFSEEAITSAEERHLCEGSAQAPALLTTRPCNAPLDSSAALRE
jgi:hypothetical protein